MFYAASRRSREIGLRVALGATLRGILTLVLRQSLALVAVAVAIGIGLTVFAVRPLTMFLVPEVRPTDPVNFLSVCGALCAVAIVATISPAVRG